MTSVGLLDFVSSPVVLLILGVAAALAWPISGRMHGPRLAGVMFVVSIGIIVALTLTPGPQGPGTLPPVPHFLERLNQPRALAGEFVSLPRDDEQVANIFLYLPIGFFGRFVWRKLVPTVLFGFALTAGIETMQIFVAGRAGSVTDIRNNTIGAIAGGLAAAALIHLGGNQTRS